MTLVSLIYVMICFCLIRLSKEDILLESSNLENINFLNAEEIRIPKDRNITLKCNVTCNPKYNKIYWEFKAITDSCDKYMIKNLSRSIPWKPLKFSRNKCNKLLKLHNLEESHNGFYRCIENNTTVKLFKLEVLNFLRYTWPPPKILNIEPSNWKVHQYSRVIIKCKVCSERPPVILWWKESNNKDNTYVEYYGKKYTKLNTPIEPYPLPNEQGIYLSKLYLSNVTVLDSGSYVCSAVTETGNDSKNAIIKVEGLYQIEDKPKIASFSLLFLIPLPLILVPIIFWLCYYKNKIQEKRRSNNVNLIKPLFESNRISQKS